MKFRPPEIDQPFIVRGTEIRPHDTGEQYLQKLARIALDEIQQWVCVLTTDGILLECNSAALESNGLRREEVVGKPFWEAFQGHISAKNQDELRQDVELAARGEYVRHQIEVYARKQDKEAMLMDFALLPVRDKMGQIVLLIAEGLKSTLDAAERKQADETRNRLAAIVESSDDAIISKDLNGIVASWNKAAERLFGYSAHEMIGRPITVIIPPELHPDETMILGKIRRAERIDHFETVRVRKNGEKIHVSLTISPVKDASGKVVGAAKIVRDITEHRKIVQALRTTEKLAAAGRLAATVAHEINNPLEAVTNLVYLAKRDLRDGNRASTHLDQASHELERVAHIARQTLGFYRETSAPTFVKLPHSLDELLSLYDKRLQVRKIKVIRQYEDDITVTALAGELRQAFSNLINNSVDAMPSGGLLVIRISRSRNWRNPEIRGARITILDTGVGIAPHVRKNLFQPFFTTKSDVGTGLGLWITRNIVVKYRGVIHVRSSSENEQHGTVFSIFLPFTQLDAERQDQSHAIEERSIVA